MFCLDITKAGHDKFSNGSTNGVKTRKIKNFPIHMTLDKEINFSAIVYYFA